VTILRRIVVALGVVAVLMGGLWFGIGHRAPAGQPALATLRPAAFEELQAAFNRDADDHARVILLLSPT
jgi:hypothetical protein